MGEHTVTMEVVVALRCTDAGEAAIDRYVNLTSEQGRELATTPGMSRESVEDVLIRAAILTGTDDGSRLDGWADLAHDDIEIRLVSVERAW